MMPVAKEQRLMEKIYEEILHIKDEIQELKMTLIPEVEPEDDEVTALRVMEGEMKNGKLRSWNDVREDLERD